MFPSLFQFISDQSCVKSFMPLKILAYLKKKIRYIFYYVFALIEVNSDFFSKCVFNTFEDRNQYVYAACL